MTRSLLKRLGKHGTALKDFYGLLPPQRKRIVGIGAGAVGGIVGLNLIRGITFRNPGRRDNSMFDAQNPALKAYTERRGSHLSGQALQDRDRRLFRG